MLFFCLFPKELEATNGARFVLFDKDDQRRRCLMSNVGTVGRGPLATTRRIYVAVKFCQKREQSFSHSHMQSPLPYVVRILVSSTNRCSVLHMFDMLDMFDIRCDRNRLHLHARHRCRHRLRESGTQGRR